MASTVVQPASTGALPRSPYKGLTPYAEDDAPLFFGRDTWRDVIIDNLKAHRLTLLYGESGVGKSSVLRASVAHHLREEGRRCVEEHGIPRAAVVVFSSWRENPLGELVRCLLAAAADACGDQDDDDHPPHELEAAIEHCSQRVGGKVYVILDQFEEYFLYHAETSGEPFAEALPAAVGRQDLRVSFLLAIREDAVAKLDRFKGRVPNLFDNSLRIEHLDPAAAREAIERPLDRFNATQASGRPVEIQHELVDAVINDVEAGRLQVGYAGAAVRRAAPSQARVEAPYLQLVMTRLWAEEMASDSRVLRLSTLQRLGGAEGIVGTHLDAAMNALPRADRDIAASAFRYLVTRSRTKIAHSVSDLADWIEVPESRVAPVLASLAGGDARILRPVGESSVEIYHDVLAEAVLAWRAGHEAEKRSESERREVEERSESERRKAEERNRRKLVRVATVVGMIGLVVAVLLAMLAETERRRANSEEKLARSREFAASARSQLPAHPDVSLLLAIRAARISKTDEARGALQASLAATNADVVLSGHTGPVSAATFDRDGRRALTASEDGTVRVWDTASGRRIRLLRSRSENNPFDVDFSADGRQIVAEDFEGAQVWRAATGDLVKRLRGDRTIISDDRQIIVTASRRTSKVWSVTTGRLVTVIPSAGRSFADAALSSDGRLFATAGERGALRVWSAMTGRLLRSIRTGTPTRSSSLSFSPDDRLVVSTSFSSRSVGSEVRGLERAWNVMSGRLVATSRRAGAVQGLVFSEHGRLLAITSERRPTRVLHIASGRVVTVRGTENASSATFSDDGRRIATTREQGTVRVSSATTGRPIAMIRDAGRSPSATFALDGGRVITTSGRGKTRVFNAATGDKVASLLGRDVQVSPDDRLIATTRGRSVWLWDAVTGGLVASLRGAARYPDVSFSRDSSLILVKSDDLTPRIWRVARKSRTVVLEEPEASRECRGQLVEFDIACIFSAVFDPDGKRVLTAGGGARVARVWNAASGAIAATLRGHTKAVTSAAFSPDGDRVVTASRDRTARVWNAATGRQIAILNGHRRAVRMAAFSRDGRYVATASSDRTGRIWDATTGRMVAVLSGHAEAVASASFSPDGRRLATAGEDDTTRIWDASTGDPIRVLRPRRRVELDEDFFFVPYVRSSFSPDGSLVLAAGADGAARVWQADTGKLLAEFLPRRGKVFNSANFRPDGDLVVAASDDGFAHLWDPTSRRNALTDFGATEGMSGEVTEARFSPDGRALVTAQDDGARLWDVATEQPIAPLGGPRLVWGAAFSPDGGRVVTAETTGARIYTCDVCGSVDALLELAGRRKGRRLTAAERRLYLHEP